jgi:hypothetical protein
MNLSKILAIGGLLTSLIPNVLVPAIQGVESAIGPGNGKAKLDAVLGIVQSAYGALTNVETTWTEIAPAVTGAVNALVTAFNTIKLFGHGGQQAAPAVVAAAK